MSSDFADGVRSALLESTRSLLNSFAGKPYALILSGGVDTAAILEAISVLHAQSGLLYSLPALAVTVFASEDASDRHYAPLAAAKFGIPHKVINVTCEDLIGNEPLLDICVSTLETFDGMELRNTLVPSLAIKSVLEEDHINIFITGDGADELLGGYSFFWKYDPLEFKVRRKSMVDIMSFSSPKIGEKLGAHVVSPYLDKAFVDHALSLGKEACVGNRKIELYPGYPREDHLTGKVCLREAFPESDSAWRRKDPIEVGSGSTNLSKPEFWADRVVAFPESEHVVIRDKEHATYFKAFLRVFPDGVVQHKYTGRDPCTDCGHDLHSAQTLFCRTCGAWPARRSLMSWSSGKDSCWAFYMMRGGIKALWSITSGDHVKVHKSIPCQLLQQQAAAIGIPLLEASMEDTVPNALYEEITKISLLKAKEEFRVTSVCYGDLFLTDIVDWRRDSLKRMDIGLSAYFPLYNLEHSQTNKLARDMIEMGLKAIVVVVDTQQCGKEYLGRNFNLDFVEECEQNGIDPCGENGEFHTFAYGGPMFKSEVAFKKGNVLEEGRFVYQMLMCSP